eukprot:242448-Rhodomonas_salina.1
MEAVLRLGEVTYGCGKVPRKTQESFGNGLARRVESYYGSGEPRYQPRLALGDVRYSAREL